MTRPCDWEPVAERDPVPGDPYEVRALARRLRRTADSIKEQTQALQRLCTDEFWDSDAGREFRGTARETATKLDAAYARYDAAAQAVDGYAPALEDAQRTADAALLRAQEAEEHRRKAQATVDGFVGPVGVQDSRVVAAQRFADEASQDIARARSEIDRAVMYREDAARHAATSIRIAMDDDRLTDSTMDHVKQWIHENADWINQLANIAGWIATICGVLAMLTALIPVIGPFIAAVLGAVALVASLVAGVCHLALAISGDGSWVDVALDAVAVLTLGVGRGAVLGVKGGIAALRGSSKLTHAASNVVEELVSRGIPRSEGLLSALVRGDEVAASEMTGLLPGTLRGLMRVAWRDAPNKLGLGGQRIARAAMDAAPHGARMSLNSLREGFNLVHAGQEGIDGARAMWRAATGAAKLEGDRGLDVAYPFLDRSLASELREVRGLARELEGPAVSAINRTVSLQLATFYGSTSIGVTMDGFDKTHKFDDWK